MESGDSPLGRKDQSTREGAPLRLVRRLEAAVRRLHERRCPPVFAFVYDEFWSVCAKLAPLLGSLLTHDYRQLPDFWVWYVDPQVEASGWRPHRDKGPGSLLPDGSPKSVTVWIPLTDATPLNGCIYVVPSHLDAPSRDLEVALQGPHVYNSLQLVHFEGKALAY